MTGNERFEHSIGTWLEEETAHNRLPQRVLVATFERTRKTSQDRAWRAVLGRQQMPRFIPALGGAAAVVVAAVLVLNVFPVMGPGGAPTPSPTTPATTTATATAEASPSQLPLASCTYVFRPAEGTVMGCSRDGTRILIQKDKENLFVVRADGSETQVTDKLTGITKFLFGSARPAGATISPDGSRVVFAGLTTTAEAARSCHDGALFAVGADGGPTELLWKSQVAQNGIVRYPTFSPDGTQIAFADGYCDSSHSVWVMNADGSDPHQIVPTNFGPLGGGYVDGLAWSPAGDRIALLGRFPSETTGILGGHTYSFAIDGSALGEALWSEFCSPGSRC